MRCLPENKISTALYVHNIVHAGRRVFKVDCTVGLRRCDRWRRPLILERLLGYFVHDSSRPPPLPLPLFLSRSFIIRFDYFLMANAIAKTAIAVYSLVNVTRDKKKCTGSLLCLLVNDVN